MNNDKKLIHLDQEPAQELSKKLKQSKEMKKLGFILDANDKIKRNSVKNIVLILKIDPLLKNAFRFNEFIQENEIVKDIPELKIFKWYFDDAVIDEIINHIESSSF